MIDGLDRNAAVSYWWLRRIGFRICSTNCDHTPHMLWLTMDRLAKVSRTIADLAGSKTVESTHVNEAKSFVVGGVLRNSS